MRYGHTIRTLEELIAVGRDGEKGYAACARLARSEPVRNMLLDRARRCADAVRELQSIVRRLGGDDACADVRTVRTMRRRWTAAHATLTAGDDTDVLDECERGDGYVLEAYRNALDDHLPDFVRAVVLRQFEVVMSNRDLVFSLRSGLSRPLQRLAPMDRQTGS